MHIQKSTGSADRYDVTYSYDEANRLLSVTDVLAAKTAGYEYFDIGALKTAINPNGITAHRTLDTRHRLDLLEYKKTPTTVLSSLDYSYDIKSNVTQLIRDDTGAGGTSKTFTFGYDEISRLTSANYGTETVSYTYDKSGNRLTQVSSVDGTTTYTVATNSNQLTHRSLVPEDADFATLNYSYDAEGKLTQRSEGTDSDAFTYSFGSQLTQIEKTRAGVVSQTLSYAYDGSGQRVKVTDSGGTRYFLYDGGMPVLELDANKKITSSYLYGADGVVYRRKHNAVAHWHFDEGNGTIAHDVDGANHGTLSNVKAAKPPTWSFGCGLLFDGVGDLVKVPDSDGLDLAGDKLTITAWVKPHSSQVGPLVKKINPTHGYRINITGTGALRFVLRRNGQNKTVTSTTTVPLNKWTHVAVRYDGAQMRIFINGTIDTATTAATNANTPIATTAPVLIGGDTSRHHFHGYMDDVSIYNRALSDSEIADLVNDVDKRYEYHHINALGSNIVSTDDNQNVLVRYEYDVFGAIRSETGTSDNTRKFTGKEFDADSNLYYYGARYYDPYIGRFTQRDPIGDGVNWYAYVANNPLRFIDPTGLGLWDVLEFAVAPVVGLGKAILGTAADVGGAVLEVLPHAANVSGIAYMGGMGAFFGVVALLDYGVSETLQFLGVDIEEPSLRIDFERWMLISQGGLGGEIVKRTGVTARTVGPVVFASEEKVKKRSPAQQEQLWDHEAVHVEQQWRNGLWQPFLYGYEAIRYGYDRNRYEEEARAKSGQRLRSPPQNPKKRKRMNRSRLSED